MSTRSESGSPASVVSAGPLALTARQRWQIVGLSLGALLIFFALRLLPTGTNLSHMDFRVDAKNGIEFCDPANPQFISVVAMRSPVQQTVTTAILPVAGREVRGVVVLRTANGRVITPADLIVAHTRKLHLLVVDPSLADYQHLHPEPGATPGEWNFSFTPRRGGTYRIFSDFTPAATGRGLYAHADLAVAEDPVAEAAGKRPPPAGNSPRDSAGSGPAQATVVEREGYRFTLQAAAGRLRANQPIDLRFEVTRPDQGPVPLAPVMDAFAHLVAFDQARSGFAHLHPMETDLARPPDARHPVLNFKVTIPQAGRYVIWAQVRIGETERFVPFWFGIAD